MSNQERARKGNSYGMNINLCRLKRLVAEPFFEPVSADSLLGFGRCKGMPQGVAARFLLNAGLMEILGDELSNTALGNRLVLVVEKEMVIRGGVPGGHVVLDRLGDFTLQFNAPRDHTLTRAHMQDTLGQVNIVKLEGNKFRDTQPRLKE